MLKLASKEGHLHSYNDQSMLETARNVLEQFREIVPSPMMSDVLRSAGVLPSESRPESADTSQDRQRRMDELIQRMK